MHHDVHQRPAQQDHRHQVDAGQFGVDGKGHDQRHDHTGRGTDGHAQQHLVGVLDVGHVGGHTGDQTGRGVLVNVGKAERLDVAEHTAAQVPCETCGRMGTEHGPQDAHQQTDESGHQHFGTHRIDDLHVAGGHTVVHDGGHQFGDDHFHDHFADHTDRRQDRDQAESLGLTPKCLEQD